MIKANELRVGNLVWKDGIVVTIDGRSIMDIQFTKQYGEKYSPISLTDEWLRRFGFEKEEDSTGSFFQMLREHDSYGVHRGKEEWGFYKYNFLGINTLIQNEPNFMYIHQLQNLYFALTGNELLEYPFRSIANLEQ